MKTGKNGIELVKEFESFRSAPYLCAGGVWTIGYGHTKGVTASSEPISKEYAEQLLMDDLHNAEMAINEHVESRLNQNQFDALASFVFNLGTGNFRKSTLLKELNKGNYDQVPYELMRWNKVGKKVLTGLTRRRAAEAALWSTPVTPPKAASAPPEASNAKNVKRDVETIINKENVAAVAAVGGAVGSANIDGSNPIAWALAILMVGAGAVFLYLFLRRRGK